MNQSPLFDATAAPRPERGGIAPAPLDDDWRSVAAALPAGIHLGTSSWSFPGWAGLVYARDAAESSLARDGLRAYATHPLLNCVGIDRTFYAPLSTADFARYASQVPPGFRFLVKAPAMLTDAVLRSAGGQSAGPNPAFLDPALAIDQFVAPCLDGLGCNAGPLVFQFPPLPREVLGAGPAFVARLQAFLRELRRGSDGTTVLAVEFRDAALVTPRMVAMLSETGVRYCLGLHARMPELARQARAAAANGPGPLVVRWSLARGIAYAAAKARYFPFSRLVDEDRATRAGLARLAVESIRAGQPVTVIANNKAEGSAPLTLLELAREIAAILRE